MTGAQPRFQSWRSNSLLWVIVQNKTRMVYPVPCTAVRYVTVGLITLCITLPQCRIKIIFFFILASAHT